MRPEGVGGGEPTLGSLGMSLSATAPGGTARTLFIRVGTVPGASPRLAMPFTQPSTCERRRDRSGTSATGTEPAAGLIASTVPGARTTPLQGDSPVLALVEAPGKPTVWRTGGRVLILALTCQSL